MVGFPRVLERDSRFLLYKWGGKLDVGPATGVVRAVVGPAFKL